LLKERCKRPNGEDWLKVSHIPYLYISWLVLDSSIIIRYHESLFLYFVSYKSQFDRKICILYSNFNK
jgi:hypothetical protein